MSQNKSPAVMQQRAAKLIEADDEQRAKWRGLDFFPTPPWAARACAELILTLDPGAETVWEPACGQGHFAIPLREYFAPGKVIATDIHDYNGNPTWNFLGHARMGLTGIHWVVTNPPFSKALEFIERGLEIAEHGVLMLCRIAFLESVGRYETLYGGANPLTICAPFIERVPMQLGSWDPEFSSASCYAAFVWIKGAAPRALMPIPPGTRKRLWKPDDAARFGAKLAMPLFEGEPA